MAAFVHSNSKFLFGSSPGLPTYNNHHGIVQQFTVYSVWLIPAHLLKDLPNMSKYQNTILHFILFMTTILRSSSTLGKNRTQWGRTFFFVDVE
jgi:hypothetical protein